MDPQTEQWITRQEAATLAGCDPDTIRRDIKKHQLDTRMRGNAVTINVADLVAIDRISPAALDPTLSGTDNAALTATRQQLAEQVARTERAAGRLDEAHDLIRTLQAQLKAKDTQIGELLGNVSRLVAASTQVRA